MTKEQEASLIKHLENLTHDLVHVRDLGHDDKVGLLDSLCEVKRQFGIVEPVAEPS